MAQLNESRVWLPLLEDDVRLRFDERKLGWRGVARAAARERVIRGNCDAGRYVRGSMQTMAPMQIAFYAGDRIAAFTNDTVRLFHVDTGALLCSWAINRYTCGVHKDPVRDRWIAFAASGDRLMVLDCVGAQLHELAASDVPSGLIMTVAGPCISHQNITNTMVTVTRISEGPDGATEMRQLARVTLEHEKDSLHLCERGRSYVLFRAAPKSLQLIDTVTGRAKRVFLPPMGASFSACELPLECDFVCARLSYAQAGVDEAFVVIHFRDGHCSAPVRFQSIILCNGARAVGLVDNMFELPTYVDARTGAVLPFDSPLDPVMDTSGAVLWFGDGAMVKSAPSRSPQPVSDILTADVIMCFRYGVCLVATGAARDTCMVLRFDARPAEPQ